MPRIRRAGARGAFTLLETMLAVTIVAIGVLASIDAQLAFDRSNRWSSQSTVAMYLANEVRQVLAPLSRHDPTIVLGADPGSDSGENSTGTTFLDTVDDIDDFHNVTFGPAVGFTGERVITAGAINATWQQIRDVRLLGTTEGVAGTISGAALQSWSQRVRVEKVSPYDTSTPLAWNATINATTQRPGFASSDCPLRVTVEVYYRPVTGAAPELMTTLTWVVMPPVRLN
jgi:hypothetical protein